MATESVSERNLVRSVGWSCAVLGTAQGVYLLGWALSLQLMLGRVFGGLFAESYLMGSVVAFAAAGAGVYLLRSESPNLGLLRWVLLVCFGGALISEGLYMSARYTPEASLWNSLLVVHLMRNLTLDLWLPFAAALLSVSSAETYTRFLLVGMLWWSWVGFLFYWWDGRPPFAPYLVTIVWLATVLTIMSILLRDAPAGTPLLLTGALWILLLIYLTLQRLNDPFSALLHHPAGAVARIPDTFYGLIGTLNDWLYNSTPFWVLFAIHWQSVRAALERLRRGVIEPDAE
ncbi:MAG: hypothetical protein NZ874_09595 [Fimbriimonadales bacterium]|nr:hypothetical protein [Fimbriimonadales bacterium]